MKILVVVAIFLVAATHAESLYEKFKSMPNHLQMYFGCLPDYDIDPDVLMKKIHTGKPEMTHEEGECSATCYARTAGFLYEDGSLDVVLIQETLNKPSEKLSKKVDKATKSCRKKFGVDSCYYLKCVTDKIFTEEEIKEMFSPPS